MIAAWLCLIIPCDVVALAQDAASLTSLRTVAEASEFLSTARASQVETMLRRVDTAWHAARMESIGQTIEGRAIWALVVDPMTPQPEKPLTVLMLGGIHAGECDGKEALLALARDMALGNLGLSQQPFDWTKLRLIFVPNFNADGGERIGKLHRPGQAGPTDGMGIRENAQGLDLNRDFIKLESPEVRALVAAINKYDVDVLVDTHTTNGSLHRYDLTYAVPNNSIANSAVNQWARSKMLTTVSERMDRSGMSTFYYGNFDVEHRKWTTFGHEPRYSTEYMGLRGGLGILVESYAYTSYRRRIEVTYAFVAELLRYLAANDGELRGLIGRGSQAPNSLAPGALVPIRSQLAKDSSTASVKGYATAKDSPPRGPYGPESSKDLRPHDYRVELWNHTQSMKEISLPAAYTIPRQHAWAADRLVLHGVQLQALTQSVSVSGEAMVIEKVETLAKPAHGHRLKLIKSKLVDRELQLPAGTYLVPTNQPLGKLAAYLLEPDADDSLAHWNFFDPDLREGNDFPVARLKHEVSKLRTSAVKTVDQAEVLTLDRLMKPGQKIDFGSEPITEPRWLEHGGEFLLRKQDQWFIADASTGAQRPFQLLDQLKTSLEALDAFSNDEAAQAAEVDAFSKDLRFALVYHKRDLYFFDAGSGSARRITHTPDKDEQLSELSPTGRHVAFVQQNNLWIADCNSTEAKQLTTDGSAELLNGILDWVYQEELYGRGNFKGYWWSPDGTRLAMLRLDQSQVHHYRVSDSIHFRQELEDTRYPKAGDPLPVARLFVLDIPTGTKREVPISRFPENDRLIVRVSWSPQNHLWVQLQNRIQNRQDVVSFDPTSGQARTVLSEKSSAWLEVLGVPSFLPSGDFLWQSDLPDGRRHLYLVSTIDGTRVALTSGAWDVSEFLGVTADGKQAFVSGNIAHPAENHLIAVDVEGRRLRQVTSAAGTHRVSVAPDGKYFIDAYSSLAQPPVTSVRSIHDELLHVVRAPVSDRHRYLDIATPELRTIEARDGLQMPALVMLPNDVVNGQSKQKLPVLFYVYGGPQAPTVNNAWQDRNYWWHQMLCQQGLAIVLCDNRAARGRGIQDTWQIYRDMGKIELRDLEDAANWVAGQPWADAQRMGVWGWSYGGYFTAYALTHSKLFKAGIAGAPVTDWHNYDAIYTERYMGLPNDNSQGYKSSSVVEAAGNLHGRLLLIHGERDDNVHLSNTLQLVYALQKSARPFDMMIYPKNRHGIIDANQRFHMHQVMTEFLETHLKGQ